MSKPYTKSQLETIVYTQLENLNAMHDLLRIMKQQNELLEVVYIKLQTDLSGTKQKIYPTVKRKRKN
ncbi:MAG: hypothetical protein Q8O88_05820 [bacterium]|nr:hypothetical protein [bacterium]